MSESYRLGLGAYGQLFAVPTAVVDRQLKLADAKALKALLYLLRHNDRAVPVDEIAAAIGYSEDGVRDAVQFWVDEGLLTRALAPDPTGPAEPEPVGVTTPVRPETAAPPPARLLTQPVENAPHAKILSPHPMRLTAGEIDRRCTETPELRFLFSEAERLLEKPLTPSEMSGLVLLVDWAGLTVDLVLMLLGYCRDVGKTNFRYIERVGLDWADSGIDTHEKAEAFIRTHVERHARQSQVQAAFGIGGRSLTAKERSYIESWYADYGFDVRMIRLAYERTIDRTGKLSFPYVNSILKAWHEKGYKEPRDTESESAPAPKEAAPSFDLEQFEQQSLLKPQA